jgi:Pentapeptide repeats (9 copies)
MARGGAHRRCRPWTVAVVLFAVVVVVPATHANAQDQPAPGPAPNCSLRGVTVPAAAVTACLATAGIDAQDVVVADQLDLSPLGVVDHPIRCQRCRLAGGLRVADVTFTRAIDFDVVLIEGDVDARGATFQGPVLVRGDRSPSGRVTGTADFSLATFEDATTFDALRFDQSVDFDGARFGKSVSFEGTDFGGEVRLERADVEGFFVMSGPPPADLSASPGAVAGRTTMSDALFHGTVDLSARTFTGGLDARGATFTERVTVANAVIGSAGAAPTGLVLDGASFAELDASGATLVGPASIRLVRATSVNLNQAVALAGLSLQGTQVTGAASFDQAQLQGRLEVDKFTASQIVLDIGALGSVASVSAGRAILAKIERTARDGGDIPLANAARFRMLQIDGERSAFPQRQLDWLFYEEVAGYLVLPLRPLRTLLLLILVGTAARYLVDAYRERHGQFALARADTGAMVAKVRVGHEVTGLLQRLSRAIIASLRPKPNITSPVGETIISPYVIAGLRLLEYVTSKLLIVVFFLSLANYNATLREVLGSVQL